MSAKTLVFSGRYRGLVLSLIGLNIVSMGFLAIKITVSQSWLYGFLAWNLVLAWLPLLFAYLLTNSLVKKRWQSPKKHLSDIYVDIVFAK